MRNLLVALLALVLAAAAIPSHAAEIHRAIEAGDTEAVAALLAKNPALVSARDEAHLQDYPLHAAAIHGQVEIARMLLDAGAAVDAGDVDESTPLDDAALTGNADVARLLVSRGADVNHRDNNGASPISFAVSGGREEIVDMLVAAGAKLDHRNNDGTTLLHFATVRNQVDLAKRLLAAGADVNAARLNGETPLHWAAYARGTDVARILVDRGAQVSVPDTTGETALCNAAVRGNVPLCRLLLDSGAEVNVSNDFGMTPLMWASRQDVVHVATLLIAHGADVNLRNERGESALALAVDNGNAEMVDVLLKGGARIDFRDENEGRTPLHTAALEGYTDVVERLLNRGAYLESRDNSNGTPLAYATRYGHDRIARLLRDRGASPNSAPTDCIVDFASVPPPPRGEADIWFLEHSGWAVRTANHFLVFDYFEGGRRADTPRLCNGCINPEELRVEDVTVFVSHEHRDHFDPVIFDWRETIPNVKYVLGCGAEGAPPHEFLGPRVTRTIDGMRVTTIESNDTGVGFVVEVDGLVLFHAGDHANRHRDFSGPYRAEIDYLAGRGIRPDVAFLPVSGCGFGDQIAVAMGVEYALETLKPVTFIPMHAGSACWRLKEFIAEREYEFPETKMTAPDNVGDRIHYGRSAS